MSVLDLRRVSKRFGSLVAVQDVSLTVQEGELRAIIGPNGAGKTTFFNLISGFFQPTSGTIAFDGRDAPSMPAYRRRGGGRVSPASVDQWRRKDRAPPAGRGHTQARGPRVQSRPAGRRTRP